MYSITRNSPQELAALEAKFLSDLRLQDAARNAQSKRRAITLLALLASIVVLFVTLFVLFPASAAYLHLLLWVVVAPFTSYLVIYTR